jgi:rhomboid protease GluP
MNPVLRPEMGESSAPEGPGIPRMVQVRLPPSNPLVTYALIAICVLVFLAQLASQSTGNVYCAPIKGLTDRPACMGMKINQSIIQGELWRLLTPMFLHGSIIHIAFNMYALFSLGPALERYYGRWRYLVLFVLSGFSGNVLSFVMSRAASLGSSTAIFGLLGAEGVFLYQNRQLFGNIAQRQLSNIMMVAIVNLIIGMSPGIDNWGHVGGLMGGLIFSWLGGPLLSVQGLYPDLRLVDGRQERNVLGAGFIVGVIFASLAGVTIWLRR